MFENATRVLTVRGIDVRVTPSWLLIVALVVVSLFGRFAGEANPPVVAGAMAVGGTAVFFLSILAHETAHAFEARRRGVRVAGITLFLFGGVTEMNMEARRPRDEFAVAAIGPYVSLVLAAAMGLAVVWIHELVPAAAPVADVAGVIGWLNAGLALFNLIPGAPLDGGRVLRSGIWALTRDRARAMRLAARAGQGVALLLAGGGIWLYTATGQIIDVLWAAFLAWFMFNAAAAELRRARRHARPPDGLPPARPESRAGTDDPEGTPGRASSHRDGHVPDHRG